MLTKKEIEIIILRQQGLTQSEIAQKLSISQAAVSKFQTNALRKFKESKQIIKIANNLKIKIDENDEFNYV